MSKVKQKKCIEKRLRKALFSFRCTSSTDTQIDGLAPRQIGVQKKAYAVEHLRDEYNQRHTSPRPTLFEKLTAWRIKRAVSWN